MKTFMLLYDYVDDMAERRTAHRPAHLEYIGAFVTRGEVVLGGPFVDVSGAAIIFKAESAAFIETFVKNDPYNHANLVKSYRIKEWMLVAGGEKLEPVAAKATS